MEINKFHLLLLALMEGQHMLGSILPMCCWDHKDVSILEECNQLLELFASNGCMAIVNNTIDQRKLLPVGLRRER